jgi:flagellar motor switch protein FliN
MSEQNMAHGLTWMTAAFAVRLAEAIQAMTGEDPRIQHEPATPEDTAVFSEPGTLSWAQPIEGLPGVVILTAAAERVWLGLGMQILERAGVEARPADAASIFAEILGRAFGALCQSLSVKLQSQVSCGTGAKIEADFAGKWHSFRIGDDKAVLVRFGDALLRALQPPVPLVEKLSAVTQPDPAPGQGKSLDLLFDVEMPVSVSFGRAELPLKDVLKLTSGSIVELNRSVTEPVEIIVNNCVIARGEVVVIEGNYGVRITQVISRQERLRTLR